MNDKLKKCKVCGRIITDDKNVTGLCPKHQKGLNNGALLVGGVTGFFWAKKILPKMFKATMKIINR